jgi:DNA-binding IscR family transcriptional regulator
MAITDCSAPDGVGCELESCCTVSHAWKRINGAMEAALGEITLNEMVGGAEDRLSGRVREIVRSRVAPGTIKV